jgi:hypothetical protein
MLNEGRGERERAHRTFEKDVRTPAPLRRPRLHGFGEIFSTLPGSTRSPIRLVFAEGCSGDACVASMRGIEKFIRLWRIATQASQLRINRKEHNEHPEHGR